MSPLLKSVAILLLSCQLVRSKGEQGGSAGQTCTFDPTKDFNETAIYLEANSTRFRYPDAAGQMTLGADDAGLRIVCPAGLIVAGSRPADVASSLAECVGGPTIKLANTFIYAPLSQVGCDKVAEPTSQLTVRKTTDGKKIAEVGYKIGTTEFLPVIDDLAVNSMGSGYIPRWAHFKALPIVSTAATTKAPLKSSPLTASLNFESVYSATKQRTSFMSIFNDQEIVDKYLPADGSHSFVASQLVSHEDLYYENQRKAVNYYETTVPVWKSVQSGNWKLVGEAVRQIAVESLSNDVDVWSGTYLSLWLRNAQNKTTYVNLPGGLKPSQFLFKYVHDASAKRGIVFVTVNNPHLTEADEKNVICQEIPACKTQYPQFNDFTKGYTYCCTLQDFEQQAKVLGLPLFADATEMF